MFWGALSVLPLFPAWSLESRFPSFTQTSAHVPPLTLLPVSTSHLQELMLKGLALAGTILPAGTKVRSLSLSHPCPPGKRHRQHAGSQGRTVHQHKGAGAIPSPAGAFFHTGHLPRCCQKAAGWLGLGKQSGCAPLLHKHQLWESISWPF